MPAQGGWINVVVNRQVLSVHNLLKPFVSSLVRLHLSLVVKHLTVRQWRPAKSRGKVSFGLCRLWL
jgi:hypothetical protein